MALSDARGARHTESFPSRVRSTGGREPLQKESGQRGGKTTLLDPVVCRWNWTPVLYTVCFTTTFGLVRWWLS